MDIIRRILNNARLQAVIMASIAVAVIFDELQWSAEEVAAVETLIGLWILFGREVFEKDIHQLGKDAAEAERDAILFNEPSNRQRAAMVARAGVEVVAD